MTSPKIIEHYPHKKLPDNTFALYSSPTFQNPFSTVAEFDSALDRLNLGQELQKHHAYMARLVSEIHRLAGMDIAIAASKEHPQGKNAERLRATLLIKHANRAPDRPMLSVASIEKLNEVCSRLGGVLGSNTVTWQEVKHRGDREECRDGEWEIIICLACKAGKLCVVADVLDGVIQHWDFHLCNIIPAKMKESIVADVINKLDIPIGTLRIR